MARWARPSKSPFAPASPRGLFHPRPGCARAATGSTIGDDDRPRHPPRLPERHGDRHRGGRRAVAAPRGRPDRRRAVPAGAHGLPRQRARVLRRRARDPRRAALRPRPGRRERELRPRRRRRRHLRARRRLVLAAAAPPRAHPDPRRKRRLRRARAAQRVRRRRPAAAGLRRQRIAAVALDALERRREGDARRARRRHRALRHRVRPVALPVARPRARRVLHARGVRRRQARHRRPDAHGRRRHPARPDERAADPRVRRGLSSVSGVEGGARRGLHVEARPAPRQVRGREARDPLVDELPRLAHEALEARREGRRHVLRPHARLLRGRHRRGLGDGGVRLRLSRLRRDRPRARRGSGEGDGRAVHPPLPRRQCVDRATARAQAGAVRRTGIHDGRHRHRALRLRQARPRGAAHAPPALEHRRRHPQPRRRRRRGLRA